MTPEMQKFIELLESHLGYAERASGYTKFGEWYGKNVEFDADYTAAPWCEMYLSWAAHKLGYEEWIGQFAWTVAHAKWFKEQGAWGKKPKPGAFVYYDWSGSNSIDRIDHVGVVTRVEGDTIHTIEGNIDGGVAKRKERDTSKVVGYGYPEQIKARLDEEAARQAEEAKKKAEEQAQVPPGPGTDVGVLQMPRESLASLIPQNEREEAAAQPPSAARPEPSRTTAEKTDHAGAAAPSPASSSAAAGQGLKKGKHAKPTTADTTAATAEPLPTHVDASATGPLPAIESPTLIGSALVAALALLAVAKTRQHRLRVAAAATPPTRSAPAHRRRRRKRRDATAPASTPAWTRQLRESLTPAPGRHVAGPNTAAELVTTAADLTATTGTELAPAELIATTDPELITTTDPELIATTGSELVATAGAQLATSAGPDWTADAVPRTAADARRIGTARAGDEPVGRGRRSAFSGADEGIAAGFGGRRLRAEQPVAASGSDQVRRLLDTRPFDPFADAAPSRARVDRPLDRHAGDRAYDHHTWDRDPADTDFFEGPLDTGPFEPCWETGPMQRIRDTDPPPSTFDPGLFEPADATGALVVDTGPFQRVVIPGATSTFDAFAPAGATAAGGDVLDSAEPGARTYRGRRRRRGENPAEERFSAFQTDVPLRGRRHRELVGAGSRTDRGKGRHRA
ncbi:CHAP domain-containing protein [Nonomuraea sp. SYSU D8015]|uniref:CHAP domain-containing protein n=1 Tax=Nonomuraea sp. SYSU D8015 TaxID=2593644 RepID=UPI001661777A|nr:CHAP domain-containing protein [Nonomuraea sp. SYSU D8015]